MNEDLGRDERLTLALLEAVAEEGGVAGQRRLARRMGVALGLANAYVRRCARKGWIKVRQAPANRYLYYLTPEGFAEKSRLTVRYLRHSLAFYREASAAWTAVWRRCEREGWRRALLVGTGELAEIAAVRAADHDVTLVGAFDPGARRGRFLGRPVWRRLADCAPHEVRVLAAVDGGELLQEGLGREGDPVPVLAPALLAGALRAGTRALVVH